MFVIFRSDNYEYFVITILCHVLSFYFFFNDTATTEIYTLSLHDALPICPEAAQPRRPGQDLLRAGGARPLPRGTRRAGRRGRGGGGRPGGRRARPRQRWRGAPRRARRRHAPARARMTAPRVALMVTCLGDVFFPEVGVSIVRLLRRLGATVEFPPGQTCCGLPLFNSGYHTEARAVAARTVAPFRDADNVVVPCGSFAVRLPEVSSQILAKKLENVEATGAECLVACDAGCLMQMGGGLRRRRSRVRAVHLAELLDGGGA